MTTYEQALQQAQADAEKIRRGECTECGGPMAVTRDEKRQAGFSGVPGDWHHAKCGHCGYFCDIVIDNN